ncbi:MAG: hypothetical protein M1833_003530 [Piccolia ochrophora]|nr:MAG: hypothetical protein M1833_003530 [Piccolia ochrophora]
MSAYRMPSVEDGHSDDNDVVPEIHNISSTRDRRRSSLSKGLRAAGGDVASDSGYSSHAGATVASSSSRGGTPIDISPTRPKYTTANSPLKRRPALVSSKTTSTPHFEEQYAGLKPRPRNRSRNTHHECDAGCAKHYRRSSTISPLEASWDVSYPPFAPDNGYVGPSSFDSTPRYAAEPPVPTISAPRPRRSNSHSTRPTRPVSYHGGYNGLGGLSASEAQYMASLGYAVDPGPPPAPSAYPMGFAPPPMPSRRSYAPQPAVQPPSRSPIETSLPYPDVRPSTQRWATEQYPSRRPVSSYGAPIIEYDAPATAPPILRRPSTREPAYNPPYRTQEDEDFYRMPPPQKPLRRPSMKQSTSARDVPRTNDVGYPGSSERPHRTKTPKPQGTSSSRRPSLSSGGSSRKAKSYHNDESAQIQVENDRRRRASYYGYEGAKDHERQRDAEAYQNYVGRSAPVTVDTVRPRTKSSRKGSDSGSQTHSRASSSRESSDVKRRPSSGMAGSVPESDDSFRLQFVSSAGVNLKFTDGFEGRTVSLKPSQDGEHTELSIGSRKGYTDANSNASVEYARTGRLKESRSDTKSRRSSRPGGFRQPL